MTEATLLKSIEAGGAYALLAIVLYMVLRFAFERLKSWGVFAEKLAEESIAALKATQAIAVEAARNQQAFTDTISTLAGTIRDLAATIAASASQTTKEHAAFQAEVASLKRELRKPPADGG